MGFAFDGDGDRVLAVDRMGTVVDGDELMALAALHLRQQERLGGGGVAVTVMTNYGFHAAMKQAGVAVAITQVGDRYVLEELRARDWTLDYAAKSLGSHFAVEVSDRSDRSVGKCSDSCSDFCQAFVSTRSQTSHKLAQTRNLQAIPCARVDSNHHGENSPQGPQPCASTNSATSAEWASIALGHGLPDGPGD